MDKLKECINLLTKYNQDIVLKELERNNNKKLVKQILEIDFEQLDQLYKQTKYENKDINHIIEPIEYTKEIKNIEEVSKIGEEVIRKGKYAVVTMAGGQRNKTRSCWPKRYI